MTDRKKANLDALPIPVPYLIAATDRYYGVTPCYEEKQSKKKKSKNKKKKKKKLIEATEQKKLRILVTTYWDYPTVGGLQNYISTLKDSLEKLGHQVDVFAPNQFPKEIKGIRRKIRKEAKQFYENRYNCYCEKILKENERLSIYEMMLRKTDLKQYDIFHAQDRFTANVLGRINRDYQKPLLFTPHGFMTQRKLNFNLIERGSLEEAYYLALDRKAVASSSHIITLM